MHSSNEPDYNRLVLHARELKFDDVLANSDATRASESTGRRAFKAPTKLHAINRGGKYADGDAEDAARRGGDARSTTRHPNSSTKMEATPDRDKRKKRSGVRVEGSPGEGRRSGKFTKVSTRMPPLPPLASERRNSTGDTKNLLIEGNSVLSVDCSQASQALSHLSDCVTAERRMKEQLEASRRARLQAFRAVIGIYLSSLLETGPEEKASKGFPDTLALARCSVVTTTLVSTIQSYLRYYQSRQLCYALKRVQRKAESIDYYNNTLSLRSVEHSHSVESSSDGGTIQDILDEQEINKLKQLYFDYFDCEVVSIGTPKSSQGTPDRRSWPDAMQRPSSSTTYNNSVDHEASFAYTASTTM